MEKTYIYMTENLFVESDWFWHFGTGKFAGTCKFAAYSQNTFS